MKHLVTILTFNLLLILEIFSQSDFRNGYIIKNTNDTLYGLIDYKGNMANSKKCVFKSDNDSEQIDYSPYDLKAYRFIDGKYYISKFIKSDFQEDSLFIEYLINGIIDIYYYRDIIGEHYLIDVGDGNLRELKDEEKEIVKDKIRYIRDTKEYIGVLTYAFKESPAISQKAQHIDLSHNSLIKIAHDYHNEVCKNEECIIYEKKLHKINTKFGLLISTNVISISEFSNTQYGINDIYNNQFWSKIYPSVGFFFKLNMPRINDRLFFLYEGTFSQINLRDFSSYTANGMVYLNELIWKQPALNNLGFIRYEFPKGKLRPLFQIGGFVDYYFKTEYTHTYQVKYSSGYNNYNYQTHENPFGKYDYGISMGLGSVINIFKDKEMIIVLNYQRGLDFITHLTTNTYSISIGLNLFGK